MGGFGMGAADVVLPISSMMAKLRSTLMLNLFFDFAVQPSRELCCALNVCYDYHPLQVFSDKIDAFNTFYPGGVSNLQLKANAFKGSVAKGRTAFTQNVDAG